jgi:uncharacterized cupin superfamily protein
MLSGEIDMMLDDSVTHVKAGDVIVQQATNHAWINHGTQPCRILFALIDSRQPSPTLEQGASRTPAGELKVRLVLIG